VRAARALAEQLEAVHLGLDQAAAVIATPLFQIALPSRFIARSVSLQAATPDRPWSMACRCGEPG
jgi:hypothetical protein